MFYQFHKNWCEKEHMQRGKHSFTEKIFIACCVPGTIPGI